LHNIVSIDPDFARQIAEHPMPLAIFDLDHTLLSGDSDVLWCEFLLERGLLPGHYRERSADIAAGYAAGTIAPRDYCDFYAGTLAGRTAAELQPVREEFLNTQVRPRISDDARALLERHRTAGDTLLLTTATNRVVSEFTVRELAMDHYLCTELEFDGRCYSGRTTGILNMRMGKLERLRQWLAEQGLPESTLKRASFYSDSINDLVLLSVVGRPVVVDPDPRLESAARRNNWTVLRFNRGA